MKRVFEEIENIKAELTEREARVERAEAELKLKQLKWEESQERAFAEVPEDALWHYDVCGKRLWFTSEHMLRFPESIFAVRASGRWKEKDVVRLDRNPQVFKLVAKALWTGEVDVRIPQDELDFYGIPSSKPAGPEWEFSSPGASFQGNVFKPGPDGWYYARGSVITTKKTWYISVLHPTNFYIGIIDQNQHITDYNQVFGIRCNTARADAVGVCRVDCISPIRMDRNSRNEFRLEYCPQSKRLLIVKDVNVAVDQLIRCESPCLYLGGKRGDEMTIKEIP